MYYRILVNDAVGAFITRTGKIKSPATVSHLVSGMEVGFSGCEGDTAINIQILKVGDDGVGEIVGLDALASIDEPKAGGTD